MWLVGAERGEAAVVLLHDRVAAARVELAVDRAEPAVDREAVADPLEVAVVDDEAVARAELADLVPVLERADAPLETDAGR